MNRFLVPLLSAAMLMAAPVAFAQSSAQMSTPVAVTASTTGPVIFDTSNVYINPDLGKLSGFLNTGSDWQLIQIPVEGVDLAALNGVSLQVSGLPDGLGISVGRATQAGHFLLLYVNVNRSFGNAVPRGVADIAVVSGSATLARFQAEVVFVPYLDQ